MPPDFDAQAREAASISSALHAAYRAGLEHAAQLADGCGYGKEAASKIREEIE